MTRAPFKHVDDVIIWMILH